MMTDNHVRNDHLVRDYEGRKIYFGTCLLFFTLFKLHTFSLL